YQDIQCRLLVAVYFVLFDDKLLPFVYILLLFLYFVRLQHHESCVILIDDNRSQNIIPFIGFALQNSHCSANSLRATSRIEHGSEQRSRSEERVEGKREELSGRRCRRE